MPTIFNESGKQSVAGYLFIIKANNNSASRTAIVTGVGGNASKHKERLDWLAMAGYVHMRVKNMIHKEPAEFGRSYNNAKYELTSLGQRYLEEHREELKEKPEEPKPEAPKKEPERHSIPDFSAVKYPEDGKKQVNPYPVRPPKTKEDGTESMPASEEKTESWDAIAKMNEAKSREDAAQIDKSLGNAFPKHPPSGPTPVMPKQDFKVMNLKAVLDGEIDPAEIFMLRGADLLLIVRNAKERAELDARVEDAKSEFETLLGEILEERFAEQVSARDILDKKRGIDRPKEDEPIDLSKIDLSPKQPEW